MQPDSVGKSTATAELEDGFSATPADHSATLAWQRERQSYEQPPEVQLIYNTAPVGLAFLTPDCRYLQINQRMTEICGISVAEHIGRSVRETVPAIADQVENIVETVLRTGEAVTGVEINGQRPDKLNAENFWVTSWYPFKNQQERIVGVSVVAEDITERKRAQAVLAASEKSLRESEARFRELADNISQFAWTADAAGWTYWFNKRWYDYTGTTLDEMQGWGWQKVHHPEHVERVVERIRRSFETGNPWEDTFPLRGRDGNYRWFLSRALPIRNEAGDVIRWFGTNTDVTEEIEADNALRELNETLEQRVEAETQERLRIWNVSQDLLVIADLDGNYLSVNPAWTATLGWRETDLLGRSFDWLLHPDDRDKTRAEIKRVAGGRRTVRFENRFRTKNGEYHWLSWRAVLDQGRIYAMARDFTEHKQAEDALRNAQRELARANRQTTLVAMTASIAHEINQPLSAIVTHGNIGLRWLARAEPNLDEVQNALKRIVSDGHRTADIITSIRGMFRKDSHDKLPLNVNDLVREVLTLVHGELEGRQIIVQTELHEELPQITAERVQLQQVLLNLIMNAAEAMSSVTVRRRILAVKSRIHDTSDVLIRVEDSGPGIDPEDMKRIFEPFFTTKPQGMGMGLSICRSIVEAHGGRLWATSGARGGSIFHLQLPINDKSGG